MFTLKRLKADMSICHKSALKSQSEHFWCTCSLSIQLGVFATNYNLIRDLFHGVSFLCLRCRCQFDIQTSQRGYHYLMNMSVTVTVDARLGKNNRDERHSEIILHDNYK